MILETDRLILRQMTADDSDALLLILSDPEAMRYYPKPFDQTMVKGWIDWNRRSYETHGHGLWAMILKSDDELIGDCGLVIQTVEGRQETEIGYHVCRSHWGRGLATEAARACRDYGFHHLDRSRLISLIHPQNLASRRVAEKVGMTLAKEAPWEDRPTCMYTVENPQRATNLAG